MSDTGSPGGSSVEVRSKKNWISFKLINEEDGKPIEDVEVTVKYPDGLTSNRKTLKSGIVRFDFMGDGSCDLVQCFKTRVLLEKKSDYTLKKGDTLEGISKNETASGNKLPWDDIATFNWGEKARDRETCNEFIRDELEGFFYNSSLGEMVYTEENTTHTIEIPQGFTRQGLSLNTEHEVKVRIRETQPQFLCCSGIPNITFNHSDSFIRPNVQKHLEKLKEQLKQHAGAKLMIFGHTDKFGDETDNKLLSERRAKSAFSLLTRQPDYWVTLYTYSQNNPENEDWGVKAVQIILNYLNPDAELDLSDDLDDRTIKEIETIASPASQNTHFGKRIPGSTLKQIFQKYFDKLMEGSNITESDFIPLKHVGCSEFNPILDIDKAEDENRRVTFFLFDNQRLPNPPCDSTGIEPCKRQCSQFNQNRSTYRHKKTFACSFYDSIARDCDAEILMPDIIAFDAHMHFMSGHCTPMPLLWNQVPGKPRIKRTGLEKLGWAGLRYSIAPLKIPIISGVIRGSRMQRRSTLEIADIGIAQNDSIYNKVYRNMKAKKADLKILTPLVPLPMDMSYAHIDGYKGVPIYQRVKERKYFDYEVTINQASSHTDQNIMILRIYIWPDDVCQGRDDLISEAKARKRFGPDIDIKTEQFGCDEYKKKGLEGFYFFWARKSQLEDSDITFLEKYNAEGDHEKREPVWLHPQEMDLFVDWPAQKEETLAAAIKHPFRYMPMYHYEPRRWSSLENGNQQKTERYDEVHNWDEPFSEIATPSQAGAFVGFKMYTALGYKPLDSQLKETLIEFYGKCQTEDIPIMCHCSPSGMYSHDRELYFKREPEAFQKKYSKMKHGIIKFWKEYRNYKEAIGFYDEFVRPSAWRDQVMKEFPRLRLCLAHFGGGSSEWKDWHSDYTKKLIRIEKISEREVVFATSEQKEKLLSDWYMFDGQKDYNPKPKRWIREMVEMLETYENFYTDISFHFVEIHKTQLTWLLKKHPKIREKIMFGTDWYMTELDNWPIEKYIKRVKHSLDQISEELAEETGIRDDLFLRFSRINPMKFYRVRSIADKFAEGLANSANILCKKIAAEAKENPTKNSQKIILKKTELKENLKIIRQSDLY